MTGARQPLSIEERLSRLETLFANVGETVLAQNDTIDVLVANIQQLTENVTTFVLRKTSLQISRG
jgi:t-SNARE complex subunit (syntaxin)